MRTVFMAIPIKALLAKVFAPVFVPASVSPIPAAVSLSVTPLSTASAPAAGIFSASPPGIQFVPQIMPYSGGADLV